MIFCDMICCWAELVLCHVILCLLCLHCVNIGFYKLNKLVCPQHLIHAHHMSKNYPNKAADFSDLVSRYFYSGLLLYNKAANSRQGRQGDKGGRESGCSDQCFYFTMLYIMWPVQLPAQTPSPGSQPRILAHAPSRTIYIYIYRL